MTSSPICASKSFTIIATFSPYPIRCPEMERGLSEEVERGVEEEVEIMSITKPLLLSISSVLLILSFPMSLLDLIASFFKEMLNKTLRTVRRREVASSRN